MPLSPVMDSFRDSLVENALGQVPSASGTVLEALMWLRVGRIDPAHEIVQDAAQGVFAYVHGMLHRMEGDFWNANYWFRRVRDSGLESGIRDVFRERACSCPWGGDFDPVKFTEACELWRGSNGKGGNASDAELLGIALLEWEAVWENALNSLF